jgi:hypothetical protein
MPGCDKLHAEYGLRRAHSSDKGTKDWTQASQAPITKQQVDDLIASDPELKWSASDYVDMNDKTGATTRYYMICWRGAPCFWWYRDKIECSSPDEPQQLKLTQIATSFERFRCWR